MTVAPSQRYTRSRRCPVCDGYEGAPRGKSRRCVGFLSPDGAWARCSREEFARQAPLDDKSDPPVWVHKLEGQCQCGEVHNEAPERVRQTPTAIYDYRDEKRELLYQVLRFGDGENKRFQQRRPDPNEPLKWIWSTKDVRRVLYRLPEVLAAGPDETVAIVEGEKDVATLVERGIVATTNAGGAGKGKWNAVADNAREVLAGRKVAVIADADAVGRAHAREIVSSLTGVAASIEAYEPTRGKDITDHLKAGGTLEELVPLAAKDPEPEVLNGSNEAPLLNGASLNGAGAGPIDFSGIPEAAYKFTRGDQTEMGERLLVLLQQDDRQCILGDEAALFGYNPTTGLFSPIEPEMQSRIVQSFSGSKVKSNNRPLKVQATDDRGAQRQAYNRVARTGYFSEAPAGLAFSNGFVSVSERGATVAPHSPDNRQRWGYAFPFEPERPAPMWLKFLDDLFRDDADKSEKIACIQEHVGASLTGLATRFQRCLVCYGEGGEGKSTLAELLKSIFPPGSTQAMPPQSWSNDYHRAVLAGKLFNIVAELPESDIIASWSFKSMITGDPLSARLPTKTPFTFRPTAGHLFLANRLPGTPDQTEGFWRRFAVLRFNRNFANAPERDAFIAEKILSAERASIVSWALLGAVRLLQRKDYTIPLSSTSEIAAWRNTADQVSAFVEDLVTRVPGKGTPAKEVYDKYRDWAERNGHRALSSSKLAGRFRELAMPAKKTKIANVYPFVVAGCPVVPFIERPEAEGGSVSGASTEISKDSTSFN